MRRGKGSATHIAVVALLVLPVMIAVSGILVKESWAEGLSGYLEYNYSRNDTGSKDASGQTINTKTDTLTQLYNLTFDKKLYPNLNFITSGIFQKRDTSFDVEGLRNDTTTTTVRPYINLNLRTPLYYAQVAYSRNEEKVKNSGSS